MATKRFLGRLEAAVVVGFLAGALCGCGGGGGGSGSDVNPPGINDPPTYSVTLAWDAPTTNADGTALDDLAGYVIYDGTSSGSYDMWTDVGNSTQFTLDSLTAGTYFFVVTAYDASGNESAHSNEISATLPLSAPGSVEESLN